MKTNLFIPKKVVVGFQNRTDTFTGKLAYVVYYDEKGVLRQEHSWNGWRDKNITQVEFDNVPTRFVINKGVDRYGYFGSGRSVARIYDTRDHEFEISISNLMGILMYSDVSKRDILEECVYAWSGKDLILLPVNSNEYQESLEYTAKQSLKISTKNLVKGHTYSAKKNSSTYVYIGYYDYYDHNRYFYNISSLSQVYKGKKHIFYNIHSKEFSAIGTSTLAECISDNIYVEYADLVQKFENSIYNKIITKFDTKLFNKEYFEDNYRRITDNSNIDYETYVLGEDFYKIENNIIYHIYLGYAFNSVNLNYISLRKYKYKENNIVPINNETIYPDGRYSYRNSNSNSNTLCKYGISKDFNNEITSEIFIKHLLDIGYKNNILFLDEHDNILNTFTKID